MIRGAAAFRPFYDLARAAWAIFPVDCVILEQTEANGARFIALMADGRPIFSIDPNYVITDVIGFHECGHAFEALCERRGVTKDRLRTALWVFRNYPANGAEPTWQQQETYANSLGGGQQTWMNHPAEMMAETWRCGHMGAPAQERTAYYGPINNAAQRVFYENLQAEAGVAQVDHPGAIWKGSPNYWFGRASSPSYIVEHWTVGTAASTIATFQSSASGVSAHYMVARDGAVYQFVREANRAWHDAAPGWNDISIGIEHEHIPGQDWPAAQIAASRALHFSIQSRRGIPLDIQHCLGHNATGYATQCPGDLPISQILPQEDDMFTDADRAKLDRVYAHLEAYEAMTWTQRFQNWLDKALKSIPPYARPTDFTGPDVTSGQPRT